mmetsp:Transcript_34970/g.77776  ORF Transcript_34970/g.77776 Transcript_34970/m.77776 type:complete len:540 (+) Transcript_34970:311-1930(+)
MEVLSAQPTTANGPLAVGQTVMESASSLAASSPSLLQPSIAVQNLPNGDMHQLSSSGSPALNPAATVPGGSAAAAAAVPLVSPAGPSSSAPPAQPPATSPPPSALVPDHAAMHVPAAPPQPPAVAPHGTGNTPTAPQAGLSAAGPSGAPAGPTSAPAGTSAAPSGPRKVSASEIQVVQNLIERCLQMYMPQAQVVQTLQAQAKIEPGFTTLVWQKLEEQNPDFFKAYYLRLKLKDQIVMFNYLLEQQVNMVQKLHMSWLQALPSLMACPPPPPGAPGLRQGQPPAGAMPPGVPPGMPGMPPGLPGMPPLPPSQQFPAFPGMPPSMMLPGLMGPLGMMPPGMPGIPPGIHPGSMPMSMDTTSAGSAGPSGAVPAPGTVPAAATSAAAPSLPGVSAAPPAPLHSSGVDLLAAALDGPGDLGPLLHGDLAAADLHLMEGLETLTGPSSSAGGLGGDAAGGMGLSLALDLNPSDLPNLPKNFSFSDFGTFDLQLGNPADGGVMDLDLGDGTGADGASGNAALPRAFSLGDMAPLDFEVLEKEV